MNRILKDCIYTQQTIQYFVHLTKKKKLVSGSNCTSTSFGGTEACEAWRAPPGVNKDSPQVSEGDLELQLLLGQRLHLLDEVLEGRLELVAHLPLHLLGVEVVAVVHVLVLAQVGGDLAHLRVELHVRVPLLAEHDGVLVARGRSRTETEISMRGRNGRCRAGGP